jgi:multidrug resistance efflux pump
MKNQRRVPFLAGLVVVLALVAASGYRFWYQPTYDFFITDDARVTGSLVRVAAPGSGQIVDLFFDVGSKVDNGTVLTTIKVVSPASNVAAGASAAPVVPRVLARVTSPVSGTVALRNVSVGDTIAAGQPVATIVDLDQLWVVVNVDENRAAEIRSGQPADVAIGDVNRTFHGQVAQVGSATTVVTSPPTMGVSSSPDDTQKVPVKIVFEYTGAHLVPGMAATVTIYTR